MQIEYHLYDRKLNLPLLGAKPKKISDEDWLLLDRQVLRVISGEPMRVVISNSTSNAKLKLTDVKDKILVEEVRRKDSSEITSNALNVETRGRGYDRNSNQRQRKIKIKERKKQVQV
ncbi:hypothetical protein Patl1_12186 [Pistacia atlantica]|uniref:Uncharacterized protein n=1 Tax=Pistacia atlantica TaxID=434234 RepID=A0ACC1A5F6_9ROSI|nr:hypothetical protein Patl1_12186 [Pistacia atlantica]